MTEKTNEQKDIIERMIGGIGRWQIFVCIVIFLVKFTIAWHQLSTVFLAPPVKFNCSDPKYEACDPKCPSHDFDRSLFTETIVTEWDLVCERAPLKNLAQTIFMFGILLGNIMFGYFSDRFGRRNPLIIAVIIQIIAGITAAFAPELWMFITMRFFCALATGGTMLASFVIVMEIVGKKYRTVVGVLFQIPFDIGHASLGLFGYYIRDWHYFQMAITIPSILLLSYYWLVPESPRWLLTVGKTEESIEVMKKAAKYNRLPTFNIQEKVTEYAQATKAKMPNKSSGNMLDLVKTKEMRIRTICIMINWVIIGLVFFGVAQFMGEISGDIFINTAIAGLIQVPGNLLGIYLLDNIGRKYTLIGSYAVCVLACLFLTIVPENSTWGVTVLAGFAQMGIAVSFSVIYVYAGELYPTIIRNVGLGTASMFARIGSMISPFVTSLNVHKRWLPPLIFGLFPLIAILVTLRLPETLHHTLPDSVEEAEQLGSKTHKNKTVEGVTNKNHKEHKYLLNSNTQYVKYGSNSVARLL